MNETEVRKFRGIYRRPFRVKVRKTIAGVEVFFVKLGMISSHVTARRVRTVHSTGNSPLEEGYLCQGPATSTHEDYYPVPVWDIL